MKPRSLALLFLAFAGPILADEAVQTPLLEFTSGLSGQQVRLTWDSVAGTGYRIERSSTLAAGGVGGWMQVAMVEASGAETSWVDPEAATTKSFYRITQPVAEVSSISPAVISTTGGELVIDGQGIPAGSSLVLEFDGQTLLVPLVPAGGGLWDASVIGQFLEDSSVIATDIVDGTGTPIVSLNEPIAVTATGRALDSSPTLPPGAPLPQAQSNPIPGVGIVIKRNPGAAHSRMGGGKVSMQDFHFALSAGSGGGAGKATFKDFTFMKSSGGGAGKATFKDFTFMRSSGGGAGKATFKDFTFMKSSGSGAGKATFKEFTVTKRTDSAMMMSHSDRFTPQGIDASASSSLIAAWGTKKGYDYYKAKSDMSSAGAQTNPYFQNGGIQGEMVPMNRALPGEVHIPVSALFLACPAGPNIDWVCTYRSMVPASSSHGPGWDFSYNISIEPLPAGAGTTATRVAVRDGQGRRDIYHRQSDGSYRCPGMFREGRFDGDTFTLTFADKGKWVFAPLSHRSVPKMIILMTDRNGVSLTCDYDVTGKLASVSSQFGQSISVAYAGDRISGITDHTGRSVSFNYYGSSDPGGSEGDLLSISCPQEAGQPPAAGPVTFTYSTGSPDPRLNGNLLSATDGAGRLLGAFTYSGETDPLHINYDSCASAELHKTGHVTLNRRELLPPGVSPKGGYTAFEVDEVGRVVETVCDRLHRPVSVKEFTGFSTPNIAVTSSSNRPTGKLRATDPDYFQSTFAYNSDSLCNRVTYPDGSQEITTYDRDFRRDCPVREAGNPRVTTLRTPGGEERTVTCDYLPGVGSSESEMRVGPVKGAVIKGGRPPGGNHSTRMVSAHGQVTTCSHDLKGNLTAITSPVPGRGSLFEYNALGQLTSATTLNGPGSSFHDTFSYDGATAFLSSVVCDSGSLNLATTCDRDTLGRVIRVIDPRGNDELCSYNALDQIVEIQSAPVPERVTTSFHYDAGACLARCDVEHRDSSGVLVSANLAYSSFLVYDDHGLLVRTALEERPVDGSGVLVPDALGIENFAVCDITLNDAGECVRLSTPAACRAQSSDLVSDFTYDERGLLHRTHDGGLENPDGLVTECDYDLFGALTRRAVSGQGTVSQMLSSYDGFHRLVAETDPMGNVCAYDYDNQGYVTCSVLGEVNDVPGSAGNVLLSRKRLRVSGTSFTSPAWSAKHAINTNGTGAAGDRKEREPQPRLHCQNNLRSVVSGGPFEGEDVPLELASWPRVKNNGPLSLRMAFFGVETEDETVSCDRFSPGGAITQEVTTIDRSPAGLVMQVSRNGDLLETCSYDSSGRLTGHVCGDTSHFFTLNPNGDLVSCTRTDACPSDAAQTKTFTVSHVIDAAGRVTQTTDGTGNVSSCAYDSLHRPVSFTEPGGLVTRCAYDGAAVAGPFTEEISADAVTPGSFVVISSSYIRCGELRSTRDSYGHTTTCDADALGRLVRCDYPDGTFETRGHVHVNIGTIGHVDHGRTTMTYDLNGRPLTSLTTSDPLLAPVTSTPLRAFTHDGLDRCTSVSQGVHVVAFSYDSLGNVLSETQNGRTVSSTHSHRGRSSVTYPDGRTFSEQRDAVGRLVSVSALNTGTPVSPPVVVNQYAGHRIARSTQSNGIVTTYQYRGDGEAALPGAPDFTFDDLVKESVSSDAGFLHQQKIIHRDLAARVTRVNHLFGVAAGTPPPSRSKSFVRNRQGHVVVCTNRVREVAGGPLVITGEVSYTLDLEGRRLSATGGENPGIYEQLATLPPGDQQMGQYSSWPRGPLEWDDDGNLTSMATATGTLSLVHDVEGRLVSVSRAGIPVITYDYDPIGRCISRDPEVGPATTFVYDGSDCIQELGEDLLPDLTHVLAGGVRQCISTRNGTLYYPHGGLNHWGDRAEASNKVEHWGDPHENLNGRMNLLTSSAGAVVERYDCDDAGKPVFLNPAGLPTGAAQSTIPIRWMAPECAWEPELGMFQCPGGLHCPDLGLGVSSQKTKPATETKPKQYVGHVTLIKQ